MMFRFYLDCLHICGLLLSWLLADQLRHLDLLVLTNLAWLGSAELEVLGDLLSDRRLLADGLGHLLIGVTVGVSLSLPLVVSIAVSVVNWCLELNLLAVGVLVSGDLGVGLGLGLTLLLHLDPAQGLGHGFELRGALGVVSVISVIAGVEKVSRGWHTGNGIDKKAEQKTLEKHFGYGFPQCSVT